MNPRALAAFIRQANTIDMTQRSPSYEVRLAKYANRGFEVYFPQLDRLRLDYNTVSHRKRLSHHDHIHLIAVSALLAKSEDISDWARFIAGVRTSLHVPWRVSSALCGQVARYWDNPFELYPNRAQAPDE